jgi:hypothetical protein
LGLSPSIGNLACSSTRSAMGWTAGPGSAPAEPALKRLPARPRKMASAMMLRAVLWVQRKSTLNLRVVIVSWLPLAGLAAAGDRLQKPAADLRPAAAAILGEEGQEPPQPLEVGGVEDLPLPPPGGQKPARSSSLR